MSYTTLVLKLNLRDEDTYCMASRKPDFLNILLAIFVLRVESSRSVIGSHRRSSRAVNAIKLGAVRAPAAYA